MAPLPPGTEVARLMLPISITPLVKITKQLLKVYGPEVRFRSEGAWLIFTVPVDQLPTLREAFENGARAQAESDGRGYDPGDLPNPYA